jgi:N-acylneuraminate cytidylyltransferase
MDKVLAIIPARGGSKKIPRKNIRLLAGLPMIVYSIQAAKESRYISKLLVSTDDQEIAEVARSWGAEVPFLRPQELAGDRVTDLPVFQHVLQFLEEKENYRPDIVVHLRPTAPLRRAEHIDAAIDLYLSRRPDCVRSIAAATQHPYKMWKTKDGVLTPFLSYLNREEEYFNQPRQALPSAYIQNGSVDIINPEIITKKHSMSGDNLLGFVMDEMDSVNVDQEEDFLLADILLMRRKNQIRS